MDAVDHAAAQGSLVIASAGNENSTARRYPAAFEPALAVGQVALPPKNTETDRWVDVAAYSGFHVLGRADVITASTGTSGSTAAASGVAALAFAMKPSASATAIREIIERDAEFNRTQPAYQAPMINAAKVVYDLGGVDTVPPTVTSTTLTENEWIPAAGEPITPQATDDHGVEHLEVIIDGKVVTTINRPATQGVLRPPPGYNGPMPVTVRAYDYAGNVSEATTTVQADTITPVGTLVSPRYETVVHGPSIDVTVSTPTTDLVSVRSLFADGPLAHVTGTNLWKGKVPLDRVTIALTDKGGNRTYLSEFVLIDNEAPTVNWVSPTSGTKVRGTFTSTLGGVADMGGVAQADLWANGKWVGVDRTAPYSLAVKSGTHTGNLTLTWKVTDRFGQTNKLQTRTVIADNTPPAVWITSAPKHKAKVSGTVKVYAKATDANGIARVELLVNGKLTTKDTTSGYALSVNTKYQAKTMKVQLRAVDRLGNVKYTSFRTWYRK